MPGEPSFEPLPSQDDQVRSSDTQVPEAFAENVAYEEKPFRDLALTKNGDPDYQQKLKADATEAGDKKLAELVEKQEQHPEARLVATFDELNKEANVRYGKDRNGQDISSAMNAMMWVQAIGKFIEEKVDENAMRGQGADPKKFVMGPLQNKDQINPVVIGNLNKDASESPRKYCVTRGDSESGQGWDQSMSYLSKPFQESMLRKLGILEDGQTIRDLPKQTAKVVSYDNGAPMYRTNINGVNLLFDADGTASLHFGLPYFKALVENPTQPRY
jgi:hypothetical protein